MTDPAALGFLKPEKYAAVERERRWLCAALPDLPVIRAEAIEDLYVDDSRLRLRRATPIGGGAPILRLSKKADLAPDRRLITTLYLSPAEYALFEGLPGRMMRKTRRYYAADGATLSVDAFGGALAGLFLAEAEFDDDTAMAAFPHPAFAVREVTADPGYTGGERQGGDPGRRKVTGHDVRSEDQADADVRGRFHRRRRRSETPRGRRGGLRASGRGDGREAGDVGAVDHRLRRLSLPARQRA